jgi:hypothetical protein
MPLSDIVLPLAVVFTVLSGLLMVLILGLHLRENIRIRRTTDFYKTAEPVLQKYLMGAIPLAKAVTALKAKPQDALQLLIKHSEVQKTAEAERLQEIFKSFPFTQQMLTGLQSKNWDTRMANAQFLGYFRDAAAIPPLLKALSDEDMDVRLAVAQSLAKLGHVEATGPILQALDAPLQMPRDRVVEVLVQMGTHDAKPLLAILDDRQTSNSALATIALALGLLRINKAVPRLIEVLQNESEDVRINAMYALALIDDARSIAPISLLANDPVLKVSSHAMLSLGMLRAKDQLPLLVEKLNNPTWEIRIAAARALYQLGLPGVQALKKTANDNFNQPACNVSRQVLQDHAEVPA